MVTLYVQKAKDRYVARELALLRASKPHPPMVSHFDEIDDAAIEEGIRRELEEAPSAAEPYDTPPAGEVVDPSTADSPDAASARVTPSNKPDSDVVAPSATEPSDTPPAGEVVDPSTADSPDAASARVTPSNKPASDVVARSAAETSKTPSASATPLKEPASHLPKKQLFRRNKPVVRTPTPLCKNCRILAAELKVVKELLEAEIQRNDELKRLHLSTNREKVSIVLFLN